MDNHLSPRRALGWLLLICLLFAGSDRTMAQSEFDTSRVDQFIQEQMRAQQIPGLALALTRGDEVLYVQGYGEGITPETQFFIASVSKSFTALAVMQLVEAGEVDLDDPVQTYLPEFSLTDPGIAAQITVRHLLNHTSGLADAGYAGNLLPQPSTLAERVISLRQANPVAAPGSEFHYFNPNYDTLARLVEVVSGQPFTDYLQENVFTQLSMTSTFSATTSVEAKQRAGQLAQGHIAVYGIPVQLDELDGFLGGEAGVITSAQDMANYLIMQNNGGTFQDKQLVSPELLAQMHTPPGGIDSNYAMGWLTAEYEGIPTIEHNGILSVFYAEVVLIPETEHGIALLYNVNSLPSQAIAFPQIKEGLIDLLVNRQPSSGGITVPVYAVIMAAITLLGLALALRSMVRLPRWKGRHAHTPVWRLIPGIVWAFMPIIILAAFPQLSSIGSGRIFNRQQLFRAAPDIFIWLGLVGLLGGINGMARIVTLVQRDNQRSA
ncbi:MAG: serine hydrolase domain-containing protein [Chloroflexota bacterium]|nr:MAG: hypothetical protein DIU68_17370 [Chloroflexota bacterium]